MPKRSPGVECNRQGNNYECHGFERVSPSTPEYAYPRERKPSYVQMMTNLRTASSIYLNHGLVGSYVLNQGALAVVASVNRG